jgi:molybdopterin-guanine dinucleotide biosynthesis protein B
MKRDTVVPPLVSIVGKSGSGKTTLMERLIGEFTARGLRVGSIKHHLHDFEMDSPGKDSYRHKKAGAERTIISSPHKIGLVMDVDHDYRLDELISFFSGMDMVLAEGYKGGNSPKVEIFRPEVYDKPICLEDENLIAMMTDHDLDLEVPRFGLDDIEGLAEFLIGAFKLQRSAL